MSILLTEMEDESCTLHHITLQSLHHMKQLLPKTSSEIYKVIINTQITKKLCTVNSIYLVCILQVTLIKKEKGL